jgi:hypothetical protein
VRLALVIFLLAFVALTPAAAQRHTCVLKGAKTAVSDKHARVFYVQKRDDVRFYYACLYRTGRMWALGSNPHYYGNQIGRVRLASPYVAFAEASISSQAQGEILNRLDLRSGRTVDLDGFFMGNCCEFGETLLRFLVTRSGAVVWLRHVADTTQPGQRTVWKFDKGGKASLDSGQYIPARSLRLNSSGHRIYWENDGAQRSARLR